MIVQFILDCILLIVHYFIECYHSHERVRRKKTMKSIVIYYSLDGNTEMIASLIKENIDADLIKIQPIKEVPKSGFMKYFWGGKSVVFNEKPALLNEPIDLTSYDKIYIGSPVWNASYAPPLTTFFTINKVVNKDIYLFACHGGGGTKVFNKKLSNLLLNNTIVSTIDFIDPLKSNKDEIAIKVKDWLARG